MKKYVEGVQPTTIEKIKEFYVQVYIPMCRYAMERVKNTGDANYVAIAQTMYDDGIKRLEWVEIAQTMSEVDSEVELWVYEEGNE